MVIFILVLCCLIFIKSEFYCRKLPSVGNLLSAKITQTEDSPKESKEGLTETEATLKQNDKLWSQAKIKTMGRKFNLDLAPKVSLIILKIIKNSFC
jgi:hypothetical protein